MIAPQFYVQAHILPTLLSTWSSFEIWVDFILDSAHTFNRTITTMRSHLSLSGYRHRFSLHWDNVDRDESEQHLRHITERGFWARGRTRWPSPVLQEWHKDRRAYHLEPCRLYWPQTNQIGGLKQAHPSTNLDRPENPGSKRLWFLGWKYFS